MGLAFAKMRKPHLFQCVADTLAFVACVQLQALEAVADIVLDIQMREDRIVLKDHIGRPLVGRQVDGRMAVDADVPGCRGVEAGDRAQKGGLAAAGWSEQREEFAGGNVEADIVERAIDAVIAADVIDLDHGCISHGRRLQL